ncbi:MAG: helix-turn-helix domain-containing protein [Chlorobiales bacterium]|nr:helix-turn-helix domain-containing protein [Chlorobiales bacterium]
MQPVLYIDDLDQAVSLLKPKRVELLKRMAEPRSCPELSEMFNTTPQKVYYHIKVLERGGLVEKVEERRVGGIMEGLYRAKARSYWLSPRLVGKIGGQKKTQDRLSLGFLLSLAEELQADVGQLAAKDHAEEIPSFGFTAQVELKDQLHRAGFMADVTKAFQHIAKKYGASEEDNAKTNQNFKLIFACYPSDTENE